MGNKRLIIVILMSLIILAISLVTYFLFFTEGSNVINTPEILSNDKVAVDEGSQNLIGGQRDEHGCLGPAGYSWNDSDKACVREWEIGDGRYQVTNFQTCIDADYIVVESSPRQCSAPDGRIFSEEI